MILLNGQTITTEQFPNNERKIKDFDALIQSENLMEFMYKDDADLIELFFVKKRLDENAVNCRLIIHYMPYSRMDRKIEGDLYTLSYICQLINQLHFNMVYVVEPHSSKTIELLHNSIGLYPALDWLPMVMEQLQFSSTDRIVFPDKGAAARYEHAGYTDCCIFDKTRDPQTGRIENMVLKQGDIPTGAKCIIVDDLCSAGGTFQWAGQLLLDQGASEVYLLVTHCEPRVFSGKLLQKDSPINKVFTSRSMMSETHPKIDYLTFQIENYV